MNLIALCYARACGGCAATITNSAKYR